MALKNIEFFDVCVVHIANRLYEAFPRCIDVEVYDELQEEHFVHIDHKDERALIFTHTMWWLQENGFLLFSEPSSRPNLSDQPESLFTCVRLTAHGLLILKSPPQSIQKHENIGEGLKTALRSIGPEKIAGASVDLIVGLGTSFVKQQFGY